MYNPANLIHITREDVYKKISAYTIFTNYLGFPPIVGRVYESPFRKDLNPSFGIFRAKNNNLLFKDLGSGVSGDAIKFAKLIGGFNSTKETIQALYKETTKHLPIRTKKVLEIKPSTLDIYTNKIPWTKEGLEFWSNFNITLKTLEYFKVHQINKYWVNGIVKGYSTTTSPMFHFEIYDKDKIYRPYYTAKRFYTNCTSQYIQGWEQLKFKNDTVFITKSLKDVMYLHQLGYEAIAPNGEGHSIPAKVITLLKKSFKYIVVFYDWDKAGVCGTRRILKVNPEFKFIFTNSKEAKDITDYHKKFGITQTKQLLQKKLNYAKSK